jgi:predicted nucleic acid-binding protein
VGAAFFKETHVKLAEGLLVDPHRRHAPDLIRTEFANALWKRERRGDATSEEAVAMLSDFRRIPLSITPVEELLESGLQIAIDTGRTVYDSFYLALAITRKVKLITADKRFVNALAKGPFGKHIVWLGAL